MQYLDKPNSYGWVSIAAHWLAASMIFTLWFIGDSIGYTESGNVPSDKRQLHISLAVCFSIFLWFRIGWRLKSGHPRLEGQGKIDHWIANTAHYTMLLAISVMLVSGPTMAWAGGGPIQVFDWFSIPSPIGLNIGLYQFAHSAHVFSANLILIVVLVHMTGAFQHLMFHDDQVFLRILMPKKPIQPDPED